MPKRSSKDTPAYTGILLAAGRSARMGCLKVLLPWKGKTLLEYQMGQLLASRITDVIVVLGYEAKRLKEMTESARVKIAFNEHYEQGKCSSIRCGMFAL